MEPETDVRTIFEQPEIAIGHAGMPHAAQPFSLSMDRLYDQLLHDTSTSAVLDLISLWRIATSPAHHLPQDGGPAEVGDIREMHDIMEPVTVIVACVIRQVVAEPVATPIHT